MIVKSEIKASSQAERTVEKWRALLLFVTKSWLSAGSSSGACDCVVFDMARVELSRNSGADFRARFRNVDGGSRAIESSPVFKSIGRLKRLVRDGRGHLGREVVCAISTSWVCMEFSSTRSDCELDCELND
jgi:hypothetical protein